MPYQNPKSPIICPKCNKSLQLSDFYVTSKRRSPYCKECMRQYNREHKYYNKFRQEHREEFNKRQREYNDTENRKIGGRNTIRNLNSHIMLFLIAQGLNVFARYVVLEIV